MTTRIQDLATTVPQVPSGLAKGVGDSDKGPLLGLEKRYSMYLKQIAFHVEAGMEVAPEDVIDMIRSLYREAQHQVANDEKPSST